MGKNKQIWKTEKEKKLNPVILDYISGEDIELDENLVLYDIKVNKSHAKMLGKVGLISEKESKELVETLEQLKKRLQKWKI